MSGLLLTYPSVPGVVTQGPIQYVDPTYPALPYVLAPTPRGLNGALVRNILSETVTIAVPGMPVGYDTATGLGGLSVIGVTAAAAAASATTLSLSVASAVELVRLKGTSGTFKLAGPPTATGAVAVQAVTYSAVNTTTGAVTVTALSAAAIAGSLVLPDTGREFVRGVTGPGFGFRVVNIATGLDIPNVQLASTEVPGLLVAAYLRSSTLYLYPTNVPLQVWYKEWLNGSRGGLASAYAGPTQTFYFNDDR